MAGSLRKANIFREVRMVEVQGLWLKVLVGDCYQIF